MISAVQELQRRWLKAELEAQLEMLCTVQKAVCIINGFYSNSDKALSVLSAHYAAHAEGINQICCSQFVRWKEAEKPESSLGEFGAHSVIVATAESYIYLFLYKLSACHNEHKVLHVPGRASGTGSVGTR